MTTLKLKNCVHKDETIKTVKCQATNWKMYLQIINKKDEQLLNRHFYSRGNTND